MRLRTFGLIIFLVGLFFLTSPSSASAQVCGDTNEVCCATGRPCTNPTDTCEPVPRGVPVCRAAGWVDPLPTTPTCGRTGQACCSGTCNNPADTCEPVPRGIPVCRAPGYSDPFVGVFCDGDSGVSTAIGCIPYDLAAFAGTILRWGIGLAGGIVMVVIGIAAFMITTASGDAKKVKAGQELISAAVGGIILIIFSVLILNFIGVEILHIDGLGFRI